MLLLIAVLCAYAGFAALCAVTRRNVRLVWKTPPSAAKVNLVRAAGWPLRNPPTGSFADVAPGSAFYPFVETAACQGLLSGYACGGPGEPCDAQRRPCRLQTHCQQQAGREKRGSDDVHSAIASSSNRQTFRIAISK